MSYIEIPAEKITSLLESKGFTKGIMGQEITYTIAHKREPKLKITIYTSLSVSGISARECGKDAIRVSATLVTEAKTYGIIKAKRVYRTGTVEGVLDRMLERAREVYSEGTEWLNRKRG